jgi:hypothetical protein
MTMSPLSILVGQRVSAAHRVHDYVQLRFDRGDILNVFNPFDLRGDGGSIALDELVGVSVETVTEEQDFVRLTGGAMALRIDLTKNSFVGPEALHFIPATGEQVVWN